jgi:hypothetical protein
MRPYVHEISPSAKGIAAETGSGVEPRVHLTPCISQRLHPKMAAWRLPLPQRGIACRLRRFNATLQHTVISIYSLKGESRVSQIDDSDFLAPPLRLLHRVGPVLLSLLGSGISGSRGASADNTTLST